MERPTLQREPNRITSNTVSPLRVVVYGDPGVGKTTFSLTFPRPLIVNTDLGLEGDALQALRDAEGREYVPIGAKDLTALYYWIRDHSQEFDTIVIDSLDELTTLLLNEIVDEGKGKRVSSKVGQSITDLVPEQAEYLANQRQMHRFLSELRMLGKHIVVTSGVRERFGKRSVDVSPGLATIVQRWASVMGELVVVTLEDNGPSQRVLVTDPGSSRATCKTRYSSLLPYVVEPTYDKLWAAVTASAS